MREDAEHWLHRREIEVMVDYAVEVIDAFEAAAREGRGRDAASLARGIVSAATKVSRLIWRFGKRATDEFGADTAGRIRARLGWDILEPLAPAQLVPAQPVLRLDPADLHQAVDLEHRVIRGPEQEIALGPVIAAIRAVQQVLRTLAPPGG